MKTFNQQLKLEKITKTILLSLIIFFFSINISGQQEMEVKGAITELGSDYLIVQNLQFFVNGSTEFRDKNTTGFSFATLMLDQQVEIKGYGRGDGTYLATRVSLEDDNNSGEHSSEFEVKGYVTSLTDRAIELNGYVFVVNSNTEYKGRNGSTFSFVQISVGDFLEIKSYKSANGDLVAVRVKMEDDHDDNHHGDEVEITGKIDNIFDNKIVLGTWEFVVNEQSVIMDKNKILIEFTDLSVNDLVEVKAYKQADGSFLAVRIKFEDHNRFGENNEIEITSQIDAIDATSLTVRGITFSYDSNTVFWDHNRITVNAESFTVGMLVEVKGFRMSDGSYYASRVKVEDFFNNEVELKGNIDELTDSYIIVNTIKFLVDGTTVVLDDNNNMIEYSTLLAGQLVEIKGYKNNGTELTAVKIKIEDGNDVEVYGSITAIFLTYFELDGLVINVDNSTNYLNHSNQKISYSDLQVGYFVEVEYIFNSDGSAKATKVKIEDRPGFLTVIGSISSVSNSNIQVELSEFQINESTVILDRIYNIISTGNLTSGDKVILWIDASENSSPIVLQILSKTHSITSANNEQVLTNNFELHQNYPNPFNPSTNISFSLQTNQFVSLKIFNAIGQEVKTLISENMSVGSHIVKFNASDLTSGIYFYRLESGNNVSIKKMMLIK